MYCLTKNNPQINILVHEFGELKVTAAANKYFPEGAPATYKELFDKAKLDFGVVPKSQVKDALGKTFPSKISNQQRINLFKAISDTNNREFSRANPIKYKVVNSFQQGQADIYTWDIVKINKGLDIEAKIERIRQRFDTSQSQETIKSIEDLKNIPPQQGTLFQLASNNSFQTPIRNNKTAQAIHAALLKLGVSVELANKVLSEFGANAVTDFAKNLIQIAEGKEHEALAEEFMHILSALLPAPILAELMSTIKQYNIYKQTLEQYGEHPSYLNPDGSVNEDKMKLEAIGKLLAEYYIAKAEDLSPEEVNIAKTTWNKILDWIKNIFGVHKDSFQDVINKLNDGTLQLEPEYSRQDKLLQISFKQANELSEVLSRGFTRDDVTKPTTKNGITLFELQKEIDRISNNDLPLLNSLKKHIRISGEPFAESNRKIANATSTEDIKDAALNSINYFRSLDDTTTDLHDRSVKIGKILEAGEYLGKGDVMIKLDDIEKYRLAMEIDSINDISEIYLTQLDAALTLFNYEDMFKDLAKTIENIAATSTKTIRYNQKAKNDALKEIFTKHLNPKLEGTQAQLKRTRNELILMIPKLTGKDRIVREKQLAKIEKELESPSLTVDKIIELLSESKEKEGISDQIFRFMEAGLSHKNPVISLVTNMLEDAHTDSKRKATIGYNTFKGIFSKFGKKLGLLANEYDKYLNPVTRYSFNEKSGELKEYKENQVVDELEQWKFDNRMEGIKYLKHLAKDVDESPEYINEMYEKIFGQKLTDEQKVDYSKTFLEVQKELYSVFGQDRYTKEYNDVQNMLSEGFVDKDGVQHTAILSTFNSDGTQQTVRDVRRVYTDKLRDATTELSKTIDAISLENALNDVDDARQDLQLLASTYHNGIKKTGDALIIAEAITAWQKEKRAAEIDSSYISNANKAKWTEQKEIVDVELAEAIASGNEHRILNAQEAKDVFYAINVIQKISKKYKELENNISIRIANILNRNPNTDIKQRIDDAIDDRSQLTKGHRDEDGVIIGSEFNDDQVSRVKDIDQEINYQRSLAKSSRDMSKEDKANLSKLFKELEEIQDSTLTKYWDTALEIEKFKIDKSLSEQEQDEALQSSRFIRSNTIDVTDKYRGYTAASSPTVVKIGNRFYAPIYIWKKTTPKPEFIEENQPSNRWSTYKVNPIFENPTFETMEGKVALNRDSRTFTQYGSEQYDKLPQADKDFINETRAVWHADQMMHPTHERTYNGLPRMVAKGFQRKLQRVVNSRDTFTKILTKEYWKGSLKNLVDLNPTKEEELYGQEGNRGKVLYGNSDKIRVFAKYIRNDIPLKRQDKDLFHIFTTYNLETARANSMKKLVPALNTIKQKTIGNTSLAKSLDYEVQRIVNKRSRLDQRAGKWLSPWVDVVQRALAFARLGTPWMIQSLTKNTANGLWQIGVQSPFLRQFSKASIVKAIGRAIPQSARVTYLAGNHFNNSVPKDVAIIRHLNAVTNFDLYDALANNKTMALKIAESFGYTMSSVRRGSEVHLDLVMFELVKAKYKTETGRELFDEYSYIDGQLIPTNISPDKENEIKKEVENMNLFVQGNFRSNSQPMAKAYLAGRIALFMFGFIWNPLMKRVGPTRTLMGGQKIEPFWNVFGRLVVENPKNLLAAVYPSLVSSHLTTEEKGAVLSMYKDFTIINALGGVMLLLAKLLAADDDDDDEESFSYRLKWYALLLFRKTYAEMSYFNPVDTIGSLAKLLISGDEQRTIGNEVQSKLYLGIGKPVQNLAGSALVPFDYAGLHFNRKSLENEKNKFYSQFSDNMALYNLNRMLKTEPGFFHAKSEFSTFNYMNRSIYEFHESDEDVNE